MHNPDNHHHATDPLREQIEGIVLSTLGSKNVHNSIIGNALKHAGLALTTASAQYLPVSDQEVLVKPELLPDGSTTALLLVGREIQQPNCYSLLAQLIDEKLHINWFQPHPFSLLHTAHTKPADIMDAEARRQLADPRFAEALKAAPVLLTAIIAMNYFGVTPQQDPAPQAKAAPEAPAQEDDVLAQLAQASAEQAKAAAPAPASKLPAVNADAGKQ